MVHTIVHHAADEGKIRSMDFNYEISCDQMCGPGHYTMRGTIVVESQGEFNAWIAQQKPKYVECHGYAKPGSGHTNRYCCRENSSASYK